MKIEKEGKEKSLPTAVVRRDFLYVVLTNLNPLTYLA